MSSTPMHDPLIWWQTLEGRSGHEAGRALLAGMYQAVTGDPLPEIAVGPRGKPFFPGSPWQFSITHTKNHVFCALSRHCIGIDAEEEDRPVRLSLARRALSGSELAQFEAAPDRRLALLTFWVLKEAAVKFTGQGLRGFPNDTAFSLEDPRVTKIDGCLVAVLTETNQKGEFHAV